MYLTAWKIYLRYHPTEPIMWHFKYIVWRYISKLCNTPYEFILHIWHLSYLYYFPSVNSEFLDDFSVWTAYYQGLGQYNVETWERPECKVQGQLGPREYAVYGLGEVRIFQFMRHSFSCPQLHMGGRRSLPKFKAENTVTEVIRTCLHQKTDSLWESALSFPHVRSRSPSVFTYWGISKVLRSFSHLNMSVYRMIYYAIFTWKWCVLVISIPYFAFLGFFPLPGPLPLPK